MTQEEMDAIRDLLVNGLLRSPQCTEARRDPDEGDMVDATINGDEFVFTIEPV